MLNKIKHKISLRIICSVVVLSSLHISAASYATDTCNIHTDSTSYSISARKFIAPAVLIGVGAMGIGAFTGVKHSINRNFNKCSDGHYAGRQSGPWFPWERHRHTWLQHGDDLEVYTPG